MLRIVFIRKRTGTQNNVQRLPRRIAKIQCSICRDEKECECIRLVCLHEFHLECLQPWLARSNQCPECRHAIS